MNTKKKNKNRPKPPKIAPKLDSTECDKPESVDSVVNVSNIESEKKSQIEEISPVILPIEEKAASEKNVSDEVPKKPERMKGKKQQESINEDNKTNILEEDQKITILEENVHITPKSRKKKNKDKKQSSTEEVIKTEVDDRIGKTIVEDIKQDKEKIKDTLETSINVSQEEQDNKMSKKKKKKRNRHDSQKSDVDESATYNLAFKNLLEATDNVTEANTPSDSTKNIEISLDSDEKNSLKPLTKPNINTNLSDQEEQNTIKNKKKGKKQKQHHEKTDEVNTRSEILTIDKQVVSSADVTEPSLSDSVIKAKIAKPVDRKHNVKSPKQNKSTDNQNTEENVSKTESEKIFQSKETSELATAEIGKSCEFKNLSESSVTDNIKVDAVISDSKECKTPVTAAPEIKTLGEEQSCVTADDSCEDIFMEVKPSKKKKRPKNLPQAEQAEIGLGLEANATAVKENADETKKLEVETPVRSDLQAEVTKSDMSPNIADESNIASVPDIIQYPRSSSQQLLSDNSVSMVIQEIPATEEIKLGIPICTSAPIIQGSGETPEAKLEKDPMHIKLTEIDSKLNKCIEEKTDIKSKMMEVNKDMEELRLSIERSLAELTALDKGDKEFEKTFQDSKTTVDSNKAINEPNETKPSISFPMPSSFVEKSVSSNDNKTMDDPKNIHVCISPEKEIVSIKKETHDQTASENLEKQIEPPICPSRKDNKGKSKSKRKNKQEISASVTTNTSNTEVKPSTSVAKNMNETSQEQKSDKTDNTQNKSQEKGKQQTLNDENNANAHDDILPVTLATDFEPIEKFEDALTSSVDDVNTTFEMIANEIMNTEVTHQNFENPQINIIAPTEEESTDKNTNDKQITPPKNLLGHPDIPVPSNKTDYKKEKNKLPNNQQAKVKVKDSVDIQKKEKVSKKSQTGRTNDTKNFNGSESFSYMTNGNNEFVYKYSFRKVFLQSYCHVCKKQLNQRFPCKFCSLIFYCSQKHVDEDWPRHQPLCFAVSTISHLKDQKHIYADAKGITGQDYRVLRMQMIVSCEKILKRKLVPWEQEALLYPRICADSNCREWRQSKLNDCKGCEQISYCSDKEAHLPTEHLRWCKSYALYKKLVNYQQTKGRLEPPMPTKILENYEIPEKINDVLASMYEEKIDMNDIQYAALTQLATAPLTVAYCYQIFSNNNSATNKYLKKTSFTVHVVGAELQFEADGLNKWEVFLLHLRPDIKDLRIVLVNQDLNPSKLPLDLLGKVQLCENCKTNKRRVIFSFQDKLSYNAYYSSDDFITPDIVCAFNPSIERSSIYNGKDSWPSTTQCILKQKVPFIITSYTLEELKRDLERVEQFGDIKSILEPKPNPFASVRPDRNFITDHEIPLLFKNYCLSMVCAA
ncbi:uncharacterized protein LOC121728407 isoform X1 [Aricia agestis]|uniref:uncharacterized protein LOC121728407 isoform X1 n=1 Tax=Aricia agestis TaxID=91739 RepID=UPI001C20AB98|nr:uncharacterized protein LOC121728407 isoform X1 [Aricia agestis]